MSLLSEGGRNGQENLLDNYELNPHDNAHGCNSKSVATSNGKEQFHPTIGQDMVGTYSDKKRGSGRFPGLNWGPPTEAID